jgi:hypothetical protein
MKKYKFIQRISDNASNPYTIRNLIPPNAMPHLVAHVYDLSWLFKY